MPVIQRRSVRPLLVLSLVAVLVVGCSAPDTASSDAPSASASTGSSASERPSAAPSERPSASADPATPTDLAEGWTVVGSFGDDAGISAVNDVVEAPFGLLAAGVHLRARTLQVFGPLPQDGRVWRSADGSAWEDVTPADTFADARITDLMVLPDGAVVALTETNLADDLPDTEFGAWSTTDGETWTSIELAIPGGASLRGAVDGGAGYLGYSSDAQGLPVLVHSVDGRTYHAVNPPTEGRAVIGLAAGPEGFVIVAGDSASGETVGAYASADGVTWFEATAPVWDVGAAGSLGSDWVAVDRGPFAVDFSTDSETTAWTSADGLDWSEAGTIPLRSLPVGDDLHCREFSARPVSTGSLVVLPTTLSYPCGEGNVVNFGAAHISADGSTWSPLPFTARETVEWESTRGTTVHGGLDTSAGTLLVGESDYRATFWFRPSE